MLRFGCAAYSGLTVRHAPVFAINTIYQRTKGAFLIFGHGWFCLFTFIVIFDNTGDA
jgi:hypothetical protein